MQTQTFRDLGLSEQMVRTLEKKGFTSPTEIQALVIPTLLANTNDVIGKAQTGTGKTAAFGIPIIDRIEEENDAIQALILTPTRELALQVSEELQSLKGPKRINIATIYGGQSILPQIKSLKQKPHIVVGTPGRVIDMIDRKVAFFDQLAYFILDEADEMLNFGFLPDIQTILGHTNKTRRTLFFSATMPSAIEKLAQQYMQDQLIIKTKPQEQSKNLTTQTVYVTAHKQKKEALCKLITAIDDFYGFVFCKTRKEVDTIAAVLKHYGYKAEGLHGDLSQAQRERVLGAFREKKCTILVGTDIAARGIDIKDITHVINYTLPGSSEAYVHRIGRTGRAGQTGIAFTLITPGEDRAFKAMSKRLNLNIPYGELPTDEEIAQKRIGQLLESLQTALQKNIRSVYTTAAQTLLEKHDATKIIAGFMQMTLVPKAEPKEMYEEALQETARPSRFARSERNDSNSSFRKSNSRSNSFRGARRSSEGRDSEHEGRSFGKTRRNSEGRGGFDKNPFRDTERTFDRPKRGFGGNKSSENETAFSPRPFSERRQRPSNDSAPRRYRSE